MVPSLVTSSSFFNRAGFLAYSKSSPLPEQQLDECRTLYLEGKEEHSKKNYDDAVRFYLKAVYLQEKLLGKYHQDTIKTYWRLGRAACLARQYQKAVEAFHRAMRMAETTFQESVTQSLLKDVEKCLQEVELQCQHQPDVSSSSSASSPPHNLETLLGLEKAADISCKKMDFEKAIDSYQKALDLLTTVAGSTDTLDGADLRVKQSTCFLKVSKVNEANRALTAAHDCYLRRLGVDHPATLGAAANLRSVRAAMMKQQNNGRNDEGHDDRDEIGNKKGLW
jgi:tetratricopeptide (TPR) repeat protein